MLPREGDSVPVDADVEGAVDEEDNDDARLWNFEVILVKLGLGFRIGRLRRRGWALD